MISLETTGAADDLVATDDLGAADDLGDLGAGVALDTLASAPGWRR